MLYRTAVLLALVAWFTRAASAEPRAGTRGTVTAWYAGEEEKVIDVVACPRTRHGWDYEPCGRTLRERLLTRLCARTGPGKHAYLVQVGDGPRTRSSVKCE